MLVNNSLVVGIFQIICKMIERKTKYEKSNAYRRRECSKINDATSESLSSVPHEPYGSKLKRT